jgi:hypothetical protein
MSNLLKEAIVDAKALRDAALKTAESTIVEKYSDEVRKTLENILEQDDLGAALGGDMGLGPDLTDDPAAPADAPADEVAADVPFAAADDLDDNEGENLEGYEATSEDEPVDVEVDINLGALQEAINELQASMEDAENIEITEEDVAAAMAGDEVEIVAEDAEEVVEEGDEDAETLEEDALDGGFPGAAEEEAEVQEFNNGRGLGEDLDLDGLVDAITEKLTVDMGAELAGWAGRSNDDMHLEMEREMARRRSTDLQDNIETLKKAQEELVFENKKLQDELSQYKQATHELKENLQNVNLSNARLLYTNRVLRNTSLNERQKDRIVEAISSAGSVTEARTIFDTLQSTVEAKPKRSPQSLSEALVGRSSATVIRASRHESKPSDPIQERVKRLAGIK